MGVPGGNGLRSTKHRPACLDPLTSSYYILLQAPVKLRRLAVCKSLTSPQQKKPSQDKPALHAEVATNGNFDMYVSQCCDYKNSLENNNNNNNKTQ